MANDERSRVRASDDLFARITLHPEHFNEVSEFEEEDEEDGENIIRPMKIYFPRASGLDKNGISIFKCSELNSFEDLLKQGEFITNNQRKQNESNNISVQTEFYGCAFVLQETILTNERFELAQSGRNPYHYSLKHKGVTYTDRFPYHKQNIVREHWVLVQKSLIKKADELKVLANNLKNWEIIRQEIENSLKI